MTGARTTTKEKRKHTLYVQRDMRASTISHGWKCDAGCTLSPVRHTTHRRRHSCPHSLLVRVTRALQPDADMAQAASILLESEAFCGACGVECVDALEAAERELPCCVHGCASNTFQEKICTLRARRSGLRSWHAKIQRVSLWRLERDRQLLLRSGSPTGSRLLDTFCIIDAMSSLLAVADDSLAPSLLQAWHGWDQAVRSLLRSRTNRLHVFRVHGHLPHEVAPDVRRHDVVFANRQLHVIVGLVRPFPRAVIGRGQARLLRLYDELVEKSARAGVPIDRRGPALRLAESLSRIYRDSKRTDADLGWHPSESRMLFARDAGASGRRLARGGWHNPSYHVDADVALLPFRNWNVLEGQPSVSLRLAEAIARDGDRREWPLGVADVRGAGNVQMFSPNDVGHAYRTLDVATRSELASECNSLHTATFIRATIPTAVRRAGIYGNVFKVIAEARCRLKSGGGDMTLRAESSPFILLSSKRAQEQRVSSECVQRKAQRT